MTSQIFQSFTRNEMRMAGKWSNRISRVRGFIFAGLMALLGGGCVVTGGVGNLLFVPKGDREHAKLKVWVDTHEMLPAFVYWTPESLPKRTILSVSIIDYQREKFVLKYRGKLKAAPLNLDPESQLVGDTLTVAIKDRVTSESWLVEFRRGADGDFHVVREEGAFRR